MSNETAYSPNNNVEFENEYILFEMYLRKITKIPDHVGVMGLFERILPHKYYVQMKTIRNFRNITTGHGYRVGGKLPIAPKEYIDFLKMEYNWVRKNETEVAKKLLNLYNKKSKSYQKKSQPQKTHYNYDIEKNKKASKLTKFISSYKNLYLIIQIVALIVYSILVVSFDLDTVSIVPGVFICAFISILLFPLLEFIVEWLGDRRVTKRYELGTILIAIVIVINVCFMGVLKDRYAFIYTWVALVLIYYVILCIKQCVDNFRNGFGMLCLLLGLFSSVNGGLGLLLWINAWTMPWNVMQWFVGLNAAIAIAFFALILWFLSDMKFLFSEAKIGAFVLAPLIIFNFILLLLYKINYQYIFFIVSFAYVIYAIVLAYRAFGGGRYYQKYGIIHLLELVMTLIFGALFFFCF